MTVDAAGRPTQISVPNVAPFTFTYDAHGHLVTTTQGGRTWTQGFDARGYLGSTSNPLGNAVTFTNDALGRTTTTALADARTLGTTYDGDGNTTQIVLSSTDAHDFAFTPVNLMSSYTPPSLGSGSFATTYGYDADRRLTNVTHPDGASASYT
jgi:YD repeat-containing protein